MNTTVDSEQIKKEEEMREILGYEDLDYDEWDYKEQSAILLARKAYLTISKKCSDFKEKVKRKPLKRGDSKIELSKKKLVAYNPNTGKAVFSFPEGETLDKFFREERERKRRESLTLRETDDTSANDFF